MPFKYIIKWQRTNPEKVRVEAYHRYPKTDKEKRFPAFTIGRAEGGGLLAIRHALEQAAKKHLTHAKGKTTRVLLDRDIETAYRIGLATALIDRAQTNQQVEKTTKYVLNATPEEIWFWTSKWLDEEINSRALDALALISGGIEIINQTMKPENRKGDFWPTVRQKMKEKAEQLYLQEHPNEKDAPSLRELRRQGYLQRAKTLALKEAYRARREQDCADIIGEDT